MTFMGRVDTKSEMYVKDRNKIEPDHKIEPETLSGRWEDRYNVVHPNMLEVQGSDILVWSAGVQ